MTSTATTPQIPAERIIQGVGRQVVNVFNPDGTFNRQVRHYGTEEQARAYGEIGFHHPSRPRWSELRAIIFSR